MGKFRDRGGAGGEGHSGTAGFNDIPNQVEGDEQVWRCFRCTVLCSAEFMEKTLEGYSDKYFAVSVPLRLRLNFAQNDDTYFSKDLKRILNCISRKSRC